MFFLESSLSFRLYSVHLSHYLTNLMTMMYSELIWLRGICRFSDILDILEKRQCVTFSVFGDFLRKIVCIIEKIISDTCRYLNIQHLWKKIRLKSTNFWRKMQFIKNVSVWPKKGFYAFLGSKKYKSIFAKSLKVVSGTHLYYVRLKSSNWLTLFLAGGQKRPRASYRPNFS